MKKTDTFGFDIIRDRRNTHSAKWDSMDRQCGRYDMIHMGVADMDFLSPEPIRDALQKVLERGILGYTDTDEAFFAAIQRWYKKRYGLSIEREWIVFCPRINIAAGLCVEAFTGENSSVMMHTPAYGPLKTAVEAHGRTLTASPLVLRDGRYVMDFEQMEKAVTPQTRMLLLCNPHNPTGRCWDKEELQRLTEFCRRHELLLFSDEIHGDLIKNGVTHHTALEFAREAQNRLIVASSPAKTFNIPGVIASYMIIRDAQIREKMKQAIYRVGMHNPNVFAVDALTTAYTECDDWYDAVRDYIDENEIFVRQFLSEHFPKWKVLPREGTYLLWVDYTKSGYTEKELEQWFLQKANVSVSRGSNFGPEGEGYIRVNIAASRKLLAEALERMKAAKEQKM